MSISPLSSVNEWSRSYWSGNNSVENMEMFFILYAKREARMELREVTDGVFKRKFNKSGRRISLENYTP